MRKALDALYDAAAGLAALFMVGLLLAVLTSILARQLHFNVPGIDAYAGYLMAGAGFLALAHTLKKGEHIRVTLVLTLLGATPRCWVERWAALAGAGLGLLFAVFSVRLVLQSHAFNDMSTSNDATPLWLPQLAMAAGAVIFAIATFDECVLEWRGRVRDADAEMLRHE